MPICSLGQYHLQKGDTETAAQLLRAAADHCPDTVLEHKFAKAELKRLGL